MNKVFTVALLSLNFSSLYCFGQYGQLDSTFGNNGIVTYASATFNGLAVQPNGKIVVGGLSYDYKYAITQFNYDGTIDSSFGNNGLVKTLVGIGYDNPFGIALQTDGKILQSGTCINNIGNWCFALVRYTYDGFLDQSFNGNGMVFTSFNTIGVADYGHGVTVQPDGKIIQVGIGVDDSHEPHFAIVRFNIDGSFDNSFGTGGKVLTSIGNGTPYALCPVVQPDGKIVVGGSLSASFTQSCFALVRYNTDGSLDDSFGSFGIVTTYFGTGEEGDQDEGWTIALQPDGKILMTGHSYHLPDTISTIPLARYNTDGSLDNTFGIGGKINTIIPGHDNGTAYSIVIQPDNKIILAGYTSEGFGINRQFAILRYNANGTFDNTFGLNGVVISNLLTFPNYAVAVSMQSDGKILAAGNANLSGKLVRYLSGLNVGILDFSANNNSILIYPNPVQENEILQYSLTQPATISIRLIDIEGHVLKVFMNDEKEQAGEYKHSIRIPSSLPSGTYFIVISNSEEERLSIKIIK